MVDKKKKPNKTHKIVFAVALIVASALGFYFRWKGIYHMTADMDECLIPWSTDLDTDQGIFALRNFKGDYNMPYITILWLLNYLPGETIVKVKMVSILFDYVGSVAAGLLAKKVYLSGALAKSKTEDDERRSGILARLYFTVTYAVCLLYPVTIMNSAWWGQCDFIYVTFLLYMLLALWTGRFKTAMVMLGFAFSFKLQAVLLLPFVLMYYWKSRSFKVANFLLVPVTMEVLSIPAIIAGYSVLIPFTIYNRQLGRYPYVYWFYPNFWALFREAPYYIFGKVATIGVLLTLAAVTIMVIQRKTALTKEGWMKLALWTTFVMMAFLPSMHERYGFLLEILAILVGILDFTMLWLPIVLGTCSTITYLQVTFAKHYVNDIWIAVVFLLAFGIATYQLLLRWKWLEVGSDSKSDEEVSKLTKAENLVLDFVNKYICEFAVLAGVILVVIQRKPVYELMSADYLSNLIQADGNVHTFLYVGLMNLLAVVKVKPLLFLVKSLCLVSDIAVAALLAWRYELYLKKSKKNGSPLVLFLFYLVMPTTMMISGIWNHLDSFVMCLLMVGHAIGMTLRENQELSKKQVIIRTALVILLIGSGALLFISIPSSVEAGTALLFPVLTALLYLCFVSVHFVPGFVCLELAAVITWGQYLYERPLEVAVVALPLAIIGAVWSFGLLVRKVVR
jgi:Gpi18-like mannosyltransferase